METLLIIDAAKRNSVKEITVLLPCYGYARQDKKEGKRSCIGSKVIAHALESFGVNRIITIDLHAEQIQGFTQIPIDNLVGRSIFAKEIAHLIEKNNLDPILCSPDAGGYKRVDKFCNRLKLSMVSMNKIRDKANSISRMELIGDVTGKDVIIIDDIFDTGGTLLKANELLLEKGARSVWNVITHLVLSKPEILFKFYQKGLTLLTTNTLNYYNKFLSSLPYNEREQLRQVVTEIDCSVFLTKIIKEIVSSGSVLSLNES